MRLFPRTDEILANARSQGMNMSTAIVGATAMVCGIWPTWWFAALVTGASVALVLFLFRTKPSTSEPTDTATTRSETSAAWGDAPDGARVARVPGVDGDLVVWRQPEPEAMVAALGIPVAMLTAFAALNGLRYVVAIPAIQAAWDAYSDLGATLVLVALYALVAFITYLCSAPLRRRCLREDHLRIRGRQAELVQGEQRELFSLDDVVAITPDRLGVGLRLLDGRSLHLPTPVQTDLAELLHQTVEVLAEPEERPEVKHLQALRRTEQP